MPGPAAMRSFTSRSGLPLLYRRLTRRPVLTGSVALAVFFVVAGVLYLRALVPEVPPRAELADPALNLSTVVLSADGQELARFQRENRTWVPYDRISPHVISALIATEDHRFFAHDGVDVLRLASSTVRTLFGDRQGGSTLTMQLARNLFPYVQESPPLERKLKEIVSAFRVEQAYGKPQILELYLNTVPFGNNAFGIESAARVYFGKSAAQLGIPESALLVGMLKGPSRYDPVRHPERARRRRNVVLDLMVRHEYLGRGEFERFRDEPLGLNVHPQRSASGPAPHFAEYVRSWAEEWAERHGYHLYTDGLRIHTSLDMRLQRHAQAAVEEQTKRLQAIVNYEWSRPANYFLSTHPEVYEWVEASPKYRPFAYFWHAHPDLAEAYILSSPHLKHAVAQGMPPRDAVSFLRSRASFLDSLSAAVGRLEAGFVALDPATGQVKAWVGGRDFLRDQYDKVALARRQPGSTFKPFVFAAALDHGYTPDQRFTTAPRGQASSLLDGTWKPARTAAEAETSALTLREALAYSSNKAAVHLMDVLGPHRVVAYAHRLGIRSDLTPVPSLGLGTSDVTLLELVSAYGTLANLGARHEPTVVTRIEDRNGRVLARFVPQGEHAVSAFTAYAVVDMLRGAVNYGTAAEIRTRFGIRADVAGKTGTTQRSADGWFVMMHPSLVAGSWVGFNDPRITFRTDHWGQGGHNALYVVGAFFQRVLADAASGIRADVSFTPPPGQRSPLRVETFAAEQRAIAPQSETVRAYLGADPSSRPPPPTHPDGDVEQALRQRLAAPPNAQTPED